VFYMKGTFVSTNNLPSAGEIFYETELMLIVNYILFYLLIYLQMSFFDIIFAERNGIRERK